MKEKKKIKMREKIQKFDRSKKFSFSFSAKNVEEINYN